jgi:hypothetical protein
LRKRWGEAADEPPSQLRDIIAYYYAGSLTDAMLGLMEKTGSDAQANLANPAEVRKALRSPN